MEAEPDIFPLCMALFALRFLRYKYMFGAFKDGEVLAWIRM